MSQVSQPTTDRAARDWDRAEPSRPMDDANPAGSSSNRFVGVVLLVAGVCFFAFMGLHGQPESDSDTQVFIDNFVTHIETQDGWGTGQTLRIFAYLSWMVGLVALMRQNTGERARNIAAHASALLVLGTGLWLIHIAAEFGTAWLMKGHADAPGLGYLDMAKGLRLVDVGILTVAGVTHSLGLVGVGLNSLSSPQSKWVGWSLIGVSAPAALVSIALGITSRFSLVNVIVYFSVALALWSVVVGVAVLRRAAKTLKPS